ncbi:MAG: nuclear transport factor 2 family protein [Candidatus Binatia bacterium]
MANLSELERRIRVIENVEAIKRLKYRYFRHLDRKEWDDLAACFAPQATVAYGSGRYRFEGREATLGFLREALGEEKGSVTAHHGHHPEIELTGEDTARGTWALYNYMFNERERRGIRIAAYYDDEYVRIEGRWMIGHTGYTEIFHEEWSRDDVPSLRLLAGGEV